MKGGRIVPTFDFWEIEKIDTSKYEEKEVRMGDWREADPDKY